VLRSCPVWPPLPIHAAVVSRGACTSQDFDEVLRVNLKGVFLVGAPGFHVQRAGVLTRPASLTDKSSGSEADGRAECRFTRTRRLHRHHVEVRLLRPYLPTKPGISAAVYCTLLADTLAV
jgi:hypothetical protein